MENVNFKIGDKVKIDFDKIIKNADRHDRLLEAKSINENKIFTVKRLPNNHSIELTENIKPYSNYIGREYLILIKQLRKEKIKQINEL